MKTVRIAALCLCVASIATAQRIVDVDGRKVRVRVEGTGSPAVIFESGFGDSLSSWAPVFADVAKLTRAFAYDRAGLGESESIHTPRTYAAIASELHAILRHEDVKPPYIVVGHSFGGALARVFAANYPAEVAGIVFVDPMTEDVAHGDKEEAAKQEAVMDAMLTNASPGIRAEWAFLKQESHDGYPTLRATAKPAVPMTLLISRVDHPDGWVQAEMSVYAKWITEREDSSMTITANSSHYIQRDEPQLVTGAVRAMLYPSPRAVVDRTLRAKGVDAAIAAFRDMQARYPKTDITPRVLNSAGYAQLRQKHVDDAVRIFEANASLFPDDANAYDSLGEAYAAKGDRDRALASYRRSLALDPKNENAKRWIARLEAR